MTLFSSLMAVKTLTFSNFERTSSEKKHTWRSCCERIQHLRTHFRQVFAMKMLKILHADENRIFQRVKLGCRDSDNGPLLCKAPIRHNSLSSMMTHLSVRAKLCNANMHRCVCATVVSRLVEAGFQSRRICALTGHKNEGGLRNYQRLSGEPKS